MIPVVGGKAKENEKDGEQQQLDENFPCIVNARHGLLTILKRAVLNPNQRPHNTAKAFHGLSKSMFRFDKSTFIKDFGCYSMIPFMKLLNNMTIN